MFNNATLFNLQSNHNSSNSTEDVKSHSLVAAYYFSSAIVVAMLSPVAVAGNALVLAAIWRNSSLRTPFYILLAGLALTDFCTGLISQPFYVSENLIRLAVNRTSDVKTRHITGTILDGCATYLFIFTVSVLTFMSIERWLHMSRRSFVTVRRSCFVIAVLSPLPIPIVISRSLKGTHNIKLGAATISFLLFCLVVTSVAYYKVFEIIRHHQIQIQAKELSQSSVQPAINFVKYKKSVFTILYILVIFYTGYLPISIIIGVMIMLDFEYEWLFFNMSVVFVFLPSSLNPLLYLWRMKDIRTEVKRLVRRILCKEN